MFKKEADERLHLWFEFRQSLENSNDPLQDLVDFWEPAPRIPHNSLIDPNHSRAWPTPWEILERNKYDEFTLVLMMGWSLLLTSKYKNSEIEIRIIIDDKSSRVYNVLCVDNLWALNFQDHTVVELNSVPSLYRVENIVPLKQPR
jgi:hypothetical protein